QTHREHGQFSHSVDPRGTGRRERKTGMTRSYKLSTTKDTTIVFIDHQPQMESGMAARDRAALQLAAQQNERKRIAQELHDTLLQGFTGVALKLDALAQSLPPELPRPKEQLQRILEQIDEHLAEARRSIWNLRSTTRANRGGFPEALVKAGERALEGTAIPLAFSVLGPERRIQNALEDNLLRICEEAVVNAAKHAHPTRVDVTLHFKSQDVQLRVKDDGAGFDPARSRSEAAKSGHFGLLGIKERVEAMSGMLSIDSAPGRGTELRVSIPT